MLDIFIFNSQNGVIDSHTPAYLICICSIREIDLQRLCCVLCFSSSCNGAWIHRWPLWDSVFLSAVYQGMAVFNVCWRLSGNLPTQCFSWYDSSQSPCAPFSIQHNLIFCSRTDAACKSMGKWRRLPISLAVIDSS